MGTQIQTTEEENQTPQGVLETLAIMQKVEKLTAEQEVLNRRKLFLRHEKHFIFIKRYNEPELVRYDLKEKRMEKFYRRENAWRPVDHLYTFFNQYSMSDIVIEEEKFRSMLYKTKSLNPNCSSVSTFIARMGDALVYENYDAEGIRTECYCSYGGRKVILSKPLEFYPKSIIKFFKENDFEVTCDFEDRYSRNPQLFINLIQIFDTMEIMTKADKTDFINSIGEHYRMNESFNNLVTHYKYDIKALLNYIYGYLKPFENIELSDALNLLNDYYTMSTSMGRSIKKYPKYLRSMHDIITANYNSYKQNYDEKKFLLLRKTELDFDKDKVFMIVTPEKPKQIIAEGTELNHCVGSYVQKILNGNTYIMFLRKKENPDDALVTLEFKENKIIQAKGSYNRPITDEERAFLEKYCKLKNIGLEL